MQASRRARERGSPAKPARRPRPSLSGDKLAAHFLIDDVIKTDLGTDEDYTWNPHEVRYVLWYYITTHLPPEAIATAFNVTYGADSGDVPEMRGDNVKMIIETAKNRIPEIDEDIAERELGQWARPTDIGWIPCDHGMSCATLAEASGGRLPSVMRSADLKTRGSADIAAMAVGLWEGGWEEILECPRKHQEAVPATTTPDYSPPTLGASLRTPRPGLRRRQKIEVINLVSSSGSNGVVASGADKTGFTAKPGDPAHPFKTGASLRVPPRKTTANAPSTAVHATSASANGPSTTANALSAQRSAPGRTVTAKALTNSSQENQSSAPGRMMTAKALAASLRENQSPAKNLPSTARTQGLAVVEEDPNVDLTDPELVPNAPGSTGASGKGSASGNTSHRNANATSIRTRSSGTNSSYASARSRRSAESPASPQAQTSFARQSSQATATQERNRAQAVFEFFGGSDACCFILQLMIRSFACIIVLNSVTHLDWEGIDNWSDVFDARNWLPVLQILCTMFAMRALVRWATDRARSYMWQRWAVDISPLEAPHLSAIVYLTYLCVACTVACYLYPQWGRRAVPLFKKIALGCTTQEATRVEVLGTHEPVDADDQSSKHGV